MPMLHEDCHSLNARTRMHRHGQPQHVTLTPILHFMAHGCTYMMCVCCECLVCICCRLWLRSSTCNSTGSHSRSVSKSLQIMSTSGMNYLGRLYGAISIRSMNLIIDFQPKYTKRSHRLPHLLLSRPYHSCALRQACVSVSAMKPNLFEKFESRINC